MNKTININLGGLPFVIDENAYTKLSAYLNTIQRHFSQSEGCEEILQDIEYRMAELFQEKLRSKPIISLQTLDEVIAVMGRPEEFGAEPISEPKEQPKQTYHYKSTNTQDHTIRTGKRLFRDPEDKKLGGVCSGIAAYLGIDDPLWVRIVFILLVIPGGFSVLPYFILWFVIPEARTSADKLAMKGEPINVENIARKVEEEINELSKSISDFSKDFGKKKNKF